MDQSKQHAGAGLRCGASRTRAGGLQLAELWNGAPKLGPEGQSRTYLTCRSFRTFSTTSRIEMNLAFLRTGQRLPNASHIVTC